MSLCWEPDHWERYPDDRPPLKCAEPACDVRVWEKEDLIPCECGKRFCSGHVNSVEGMMLCSMCEMEPVTP